MNPTTPVMFPTGLHRDAVSRASDQWLTDVAQLVEPEIREHIVCRYPDGDAFHLQVAAEFLNWIFIIDDWMVRYAVRVFSRFRETAGLGCTERFIHGVELFFAAVAKQVDDRAKGNVYDPQSYIALRRDLVAHKYSFSIIEFVARIDLPDEVMLHPVIKALEDAIGDHVAWANDILSYNKEQSRGSAPWENIVAVLMHDRGLDLQGAIDYAGQMCKDAIQRFESSPAILPSWEEEVDRQVAIYVEGLQKFMVGSLHWHLSSPRYDVKPDRIIKLLPKRPL
ncbi:isoprenoid synthase domain-containing protein [Suillus subluteus]|nr:isoprenoid synthase domain-containing protein [Suillus subluteus]